MSKTCSRHIVTDSIRIEPGIADHSLIAFRIHAERPQLPIKFITTRKLKNIDVNAFWTDFWRAFAIPDANRDDLNTLFDEFENVCR
jgi:hypothetical protein